MESDEHTQKLTSLLNTMDVLAEASRMHRAEVTRKPAEAFTPIDVAYLIRNYVLTLNMADQCIDYARRTATNFNDFRVANERVIERHKTRCEELATENDYLRSLLEESING